MIRTVNTAAAVAALCLVAGCAAEGATGMTGSAHSTYEDAGKDEMDAGSPPADAGQPPTCTYTQGYWKNHLPSGHTITILGVPYDTVRVLRTPPKCGNATLILGHQLIAAILNGGESDSNVSSVIDAAYAWLTDYAEGRLDEPVCGGEEGHEEGTYIADLLAAYNEGRMGTPHCDRRGDYSGFPR